MLRIVKKAKYYGTTCLGILNGKKYVKMSKNLKNFCNGYQNGRSRQTNSLNKYTCRRKCRVLEV